MNQLKNYLNLVVIIALLSVGFGQINQAQEPLTTDTLENLLITGMEKGIKGDYQGAIATFSQVITLDPQAVEAYYNRGVAYLRINEIEKAIADFNTAIGLNPNHAEAFVERGNVYLTLDQKDKGIQDLQTALNLFKQQGNEAAYRWLESRLIELNIEP